MSTKKKAPSIVLEMVEMERGLGATRNTKTAYGSSQIELKRIAGYLCSESLSFQFPLHKLFSMNQDHLTPGNISYFKSLIPIRLLLAHGMSGMCDMDFLISVSPLQCTVTSPSIARLFNTASIAFNRILRHTMCLAAF